MSNSQNILPNHLLFMEVRGGNSKIIISFKYLCQFLLILGFMTSFSQWIYFSKNHLFFENFTSYITHFQIIYIKCVNHILMTVASL